MKAHALSAFDESQSYTSPERRLMLATIANAVADAMGNGAVDHPPQREKVQRDALAWFRAGNSDFETVCHLAGLDPESTRRAVFDFMASGEPMPRRHAMAHASPRSTINRSRRTSKPWPCSANADQIAAHAGVSPSAVRAVIYANAPTSAQMQRRVFTAIQDLAQEAANDA